MIKYTLKCDDDHTFDSWFQSSEAYEKLAKTGMIACAVCGSATVTKALMAPRVKTDEDAAQPVALAEPQSDMEKALQEFRDKVEANSDYVGKDFATEARAMHDGEAPHRSIYGEARLEDARSLIEDGVPVAPLPFKPKAKTN